MGQASGACCSAGLLGVEEACQQGLLGRESETEILWVESGQPGALGEGGRSEVVQPGWVGGAWGRNQAARQVWNIPGCVGGWDSPVGLWGQIRSRQERELSHGGYFRGGWMPAWAAEAPEGRGTLGPG